MNYSLFISCPKGLEYLLEEEVKSLGFEVSRVSPNGVYGEGSLALAYQLCLWSRIANRVHCVLFSGHVLNEKSLHQLCLEFPWITVMDSNKTFAIDFHGQSEQFRNTMFGAQIIKDGIVDHFREQEGTRPSVDKENPQIRLHAHLKNDFITVSLDLTGYSLHQRGYRTKAGIAPLKENVAAAILMRAKWPELSTQGYALYDPFCGAGTLVIEAAMIASNMAPGLLRQDQSFQYWNHHQPALWEKLRQEAFAAMKPTTLSLIGSDTDADVIHFAKANAINAGVEAMVRFDNLPLSACKAPEKKGLIICNPPYGERLGSESNLIPLYQHVGMTLKEKFPDWEAAVLTASPLLAKAIGLRSTKQYKIYNGALECKLYTFSINTNNTLKTGSTGLSSGAQMFTNRVVKNFDHLKKWAKNLNISCYRVYDADLPEYSAAIDIYNNYAVLQAYKAPASIDPEKAERRRVEMIQALPIALGLPSEHIIVKERQKQKGTNQYNKLDEKRHNLEVTEGRAKLLVNLYDYLDTGLFLDHRILRLRFEKLEPGSRFLNCFCYTATASVHAAIAGAKTTNVDLSRTYLNWAEENFKLNKINTNQHQFVQYDCLEWLRISKDRFDTIFLDPPSFSNSKRTAETLDIQRDHVVLIDAAMRLLNPGGELFFSTNLRQFKLDASLVEKYLIKNITEETLDVDFKRNKKIHQCYTISRRIE